MEKAKAKTVEEYLAAQPEATRAALERVRQTLRKALPGAEEAISYSIPAFKTGGRVLIFYAGWKEHFSIYPVNERIVEACGGDAAKYKISKGTVRFPLAEPVPVRLIARIARMMAEEAKVRQKVKERP